MKRKLFMKKSQSRAGSGFARVMTMLTLTLTMLCVQSANAFTLTCLRGNGFGGYEGCQYLFDGTQNTKWGTSDGWDGKPVYAVAKATMPIAPTTYSLKIANDTYQSPDRNWKSWRIFGGNFASDEEAVNGAEGWVLIDQKVDQQMTTDQYAEVQFDLSDPDGKFYSYFMIVVDAICSNPNWGAYCQMAEFWFRDFKIDLSEAQVYIDFDYTTADDDNIKAEYELKLQDLKDAIYTNDPDLIAPAIEAIEPIYKKINKIFSVTLKNGTADADKWTIKPVEAKPGTEIKATYTGKLKVKSVKAVKKGGAAPEKTYYYGDGYYTVDGGSGGITTKEQHNSLVDNNLGTKWGQNKPNGGWYIEFHTASAIQVNGYMLRTGNDTQGQSNRNPTDWVLKGKKNSGDSWTVIDTKVNNNDLPNENDAETDFDVATPGEYRYVRLEISNNKGNGGFMQLSEMRLFKYVTWNATTKQATFTMPDGDVELQVEYFAESNLYLSEDALKDKGSIAVTAGELGVEFGEDGKSANTITEGTAMTVKYTGSKKVIGVKAVKKATVSKTIDLSQVTVDTTVEDGYTITGTLNANVQISIADGATVTLSGMAVNNGITCLGNATIVLAKGTENRISSSNTALIVGPAGTTLTIEGEGQLYATGGGDKAGIGSQNKSESGNIVINGGIIEAKATYGAAIGAADGGGKIGDITINGGKVTAEQLQGYGAGIGSGDSYDGGSTCGNITITGGEVTAIGKGAAPGIGAGGLESDYNSTCGNITITGGKVTASGGDNAAGIGTGAKTDQDSNSSCGNITISGGTVIAQKGGGGANYDVGPGNNGQVGTVNVTVSVKDNNNNDATIYKP